LSVAGLLTNNGTIQLDSGGVLNGAVLVNAKTSINGAGVLSGAIQNNGTVEAKGGTLVVGGGITGTGVLQIDSGAGLELGATGGSQSIAFATGGNETLKIDSLTAMPAPISGFAGGDVIDLAGLSLTADSYVGGVLSLYRAGGVLAGALSLAGTYANKTFALSSDGRGGTNVTLVANAAPSITAPASAKIVLKVHTPVAGISISDADAAAASETFTVVLSDPAGYLKVTAAPGSVVTGTAKKLTIVGTLAQVNADLATLTDYFARPVSGDAISITANDGNGGIASAVIALSTSATAAAPAAGPNPTLLAQFVAAGLGSSAPGQSLALDSTLPLSHGSYLAAQH
jgi:hypothetical protein